MKLKKNCRQSFISTTHATSSEENYSNEALLQAVYHKIHRMTFIQRLNFSVTALALGEERVILIVIECTVCVREFAYAYA
jgi:hypothetical protein